MKSDRFIICYDDIKCNEDKCFIDILINYQRAKLLAIFILILLGFVFMKIGAKDKISNNLNNLIFEIYHTKSLGFYFLIIIFI